jgi:hypothetical protein
MECRMRVAVRAVRLGVGVVSGVWASGFGPREHFDWLNVAPQPSDSIILEHLRLSAVETRSALLKTN